MTEQPKMTLPNGDVLRDGDWGVTSEGDVVQVSLDGHGLFAWATPDNEAGYWLTYRQDRRYMSNDNHVLDIIARAPAPSTRPADELDLTRLFKPVVAWHPDTMAKMQAWEHGIECLCSNGRWALAPRPHWIKNICYRAKPAPAAIRATIPWEFLRDDIQLVAQDEDGGWWGFTREAEAQTSYWSGTEAVTLHYLKFPQGNEHWTATLQQRPT